MEAADLFETELELGSEETPALGSGVAKTSMGILVRDAVSRRLIESAAAQLDLLPVKLDEAALGAESLASFEIIIAEQPEASVIKAVFEEEQHAEGIVPALVAAHLGERQGAQPEGHFDGVLTLPLEPAPLVAQLSLILYAHRAFAKRYNSALEELHLNRRIFRSVTAGISVANATLPDMPLVYVNPAFEVMTGYALEEVLGRNCRFLQGEDTDQPGLTAIREAIRDRRETTAILRNYRKDGTPFWNELSLSPIRNRQGEVTHFVGIQTDVTARVEFEAALRESEKLAAVGRLASSIAHEINNPLESVMNLLYLARQTKDHVEMQRYLNVADQELRRVALITAQSLRFYKQSTRPRAAQPAELLDSVLSMYAGQLENAHVKVTREDRAESAIVCLDSEIRQVLNNLVRNAIDAMRATGGRLRVRSRDATEWRTGARGVLITVADTGSGMSRETQRNIYTAFFTTKGIGGTGLGLWISGEIVNRHHGRLLVRSSQRPERSGAVFELFLPYQGRPE
jgi:PAS domain S-box-containing protein